MQNPFPLPASQSFLPGTKFLLQPKFGPGGERVVPKECFPAAYNLLSGLKATSERTPPKGTICRELFR